MDWGKKYGYFSSRKTPRPTTTRCATCSRARWALPTRRSGSTRDSLPSTGSTVRPRVITTWTRRPREVKKATSAYERPQPHACFILSIEDDLVNEGGIMDLITREARLFKYGSGTGTNYSKLRASSEPLFRRRCLLGAPVLPQGKRQVRFLHQERRHHASRRAHGDPGCGSP